MSMVVTLAQAKRSGAVFDSSAAMAKEKIAYTCTTRMARPLWLIVENASSMLVHVLRSFRGAFVGEWSTPSGVHVCKH